MSRQVENLTAAEARAIIADLDALEGWPAKGTFGPGAEHLEAACDAWLAGDRTGPPPPGITATQARPEPDPGTRNRFAVQVTDEQRFHLRGRTLGGKRLGDAAFRLRTARWERNNEA